jgi:hypothetical protein
VSGGGSGHEVRTPERPEAVSGGGSGHEVRTPERPEAVSGGGSGPGATAMRFRVDPWSVEYGASVESDLSLSEVEVNVEVERPEEGWGPVAPQPDAPQPPVVLFVDGVRRVDARVWIEETGGDAQPGICASFGAGVARCGDGLPAEVIHASVGRGVFSASVHALDIATAHGSYTAHVAAGSTPEALWIALQERMARREVEAAEAARRDLGAPDDALVVVDGPLSGRQHIAGAIGVIKTHGVAYLPPDLHRVVGRLGPGARTPVFAIGGRWSRYSWYLRLPGGVDAPWAGVVRVECSTELSAPGAIGLADCVGVTLSRYASEPYKDPRAPQNLYPIGGLERELRHRLGDARLLFRGLRSAAALHAG